MANHGRGLLTLDETAKHLGVSRSTVSRLVKSGELPSVKIGKARKSPRRIRSVDLTAFVSARREHAGAPDSD